MANLYFYDKNGEKIPIKISGTVAEPVRVDDYLMSVNVNNLDYEFARAHFSENNGGESVPSGCSVVFKNGKFGRNFDWKYDEKPSYIVRTSNTIGIAGAVPDGIDSRLIPFYLMDGINDHGLTAATLVVNSEGVENTNVPTVEIRDSICATMFVRYVLDHFRTVAEAVAYLDNYVEVWFPTSLHAMGYEAHWMLADRTGASVVVEIIEGRVRTVNSDAVTNFYMNGVSLNDDGTVYTPATLSQGSPTTDNGILEHGSGLERFNLIAGWTGNVADLMSALEYTNTYVGLDWHTEFVAGGLHCDSPVSAFASVEASAAEAYAHRTRDGATWQTVHSAVYDLDTLEMRLVVQEQATVYIIPFGVATTVNGKAGAVTLDGTEIYVSRSDTQPKTIAETLVQQSETIAAKEDAGNKVISLSASSTDAQYPSAKCVYDYSLRDWVGTQAEYNAIAIKDAHTIYNIVEATT